MKVLGLSNEKEEQKAIRSKNCHSLLPNSLPKFFNLHSHKAAMAVSPDQHPPSPVLLQAVDEIMRIYRSLPRRPSIEEVEAAASVVQTVNNEEQAKLEEISKKEAPQGVPVELFSVLRQVRENVVLLHSHRQKREALHLVELDKMFQTFDDLIQRTSRVVSGGTSAEKVVGVSEPVEKFEISDESLVKKVEDKESERNDKKGLVRNLSAKAILSSGGDFGKMSLMKVAALIENSAKKGSIVLDLKGKLMDQMESLPVSIGKLSDLTELDLSENKITVLPPSIVSLRSLVKLDLHSNQLASLPDSLGELVNLTDFELRANRLKSLPASFGNLTNLVNLNLSSNQFTHLPETIGNLTCLKRLNMETNELEELPYTIGSCSSLMELRLDFNQLKALPEAVGKLGNLQILTLHYNRIKGLPTTMGNLLNLKELDVSFNELESIPENLCFAVNLKKLNVGKNFADLRFLPRSIGNLEMLEELDISANQITALPESFRFLSKLRVLQIDETPLEDPPKQILKIGAQAVVQYMSDSVAKRNVKPQQQENKDFLFWVCSILCSHKRDST